MSNYVTIELRHGGYLSVEPYYNYVGGDVDIIGHFDPNLFNYWELLEIVVTCGHPFTSKLYYKLPNKSLEANGLVCIKGDKEIMEMMEAHRGQDLWIIYV